jgi:hypothetical protein
MSVGNTATSSYNVLYSYKEKFTDIWESVFCLLQSFSAKKIRLAQRLSDVEHHVNDLALEGGGGGADPLIPI